MKLLIIDDDSDMLLFLKTRLEEKGFAVDTANDGERGSYRARTNEYDLILLDYSLPNKDGFTICREIRTHPENKRASTPIIMISVISDVPYKIEGLNTGADDYVAKPFFFDELFARIQTILRRPAIRESAVITIDDLVIDSDKQEVRRGGERIYLTRKEFSLLEYLAKNAGRVVSRGTITDHVWDMTLDPFSNTIETHILNLRKKVEHKDKRKLIHSVPGRGYKIDVE
jgi:two-component system, OmpR family, response regulator